MSRVTLAGPPRRRYDECGVAQRFGAGAATLSPSDDPHENVS